MQREIKFRAWDGEQMIILENSGLQYFDFEGSYSLGFTVDGYSDFWAHENYKNASKKSSQFPIMQFTGLTDKNGKEIYEGDVIEFTVNPSFYINAKLGDRYIIEYYGAGFFMKPINWKMRKIDAQNYVGLLPPYQTSNMSNHYEVIGNIHENPELLECK